MPDPTAQAVDHADGRLADQRDVTVKLGEAVMGMLPRGIGAFRILAERGAGKVGASNVCGHRATAGRLPHRRRRPTPVRTMTRIFGSSSPARMYSPTLGDSTVLFGCPDECVQTVGAVEPDPEYAAIFRLVG